LHLAAWAVMPEHSDELGEPANCRARQATTVVLVNIGVFVGLLVAMEVGLRLFRPEYIFYSRTQPGQFENRTS
jgi:hypothetical protein